MKKAVKTRDNLKVFYDYIQRDAKKPVLLYLHGLGGNWTEWTGVSKVVRKKGYSTLCIDLRGHGRSSTPEELEYYHLENFAHDIQQILKKEKIKKFAMIGHSFGGSLAIAYCTEFKNLQPKALILIQSTYRYPYKKYREMNTNPAIGYILRGLINKGVIKNKRFDKLKTLDLQKITRENLLFQLFDEIYYTPFKAVLECLDSAEVYATTKEKKIISTLKSINFPTLVIAGKKDKVIKFEYAAELHTLIPRSQLKVFEPGSHQLPLEKPKELGKEILNFLTGIKF